MIRSTKQTEKNDLQKYIRGGRINQLLVKTASWQRQTLRIFQIAALKQLMREKEQIYFKAKKLLCKHQLNDTHPIKLI